LTNNDFERDPLSVRLETSDLEFSENKEKLIKQDSVNQEFVDSLKYNQHKNNHTDNYIS